MIVRRFSAAHARAAECTSRRVTTGSSRPRIPSATSSRPWTSPSKRSRPCASNSAHSPSRKHRLRLNMLQNDNRDLPGGVLLVADKGGHRFGLGVEHLAAVGAKLLDQFTVEFAHCLLVELRHGGLLFSGKLCLIVNPVWQFI